MARNHTSGPAPSPAPSGGRLLTWLGGVLIPLGLLIYGYVCIHSGHISILGSAGTAGVNHAAAFWMAIACLGLGAFLHFQFYWAMKQRLRPFSQKLKIAALMVYVPSVCYALYLVFDDV